ncbi:Aminoacyl-tRNA hydrolase [Candidatus Bealeia paramacronuclearis]|uniref:Peptidyl-tRNA hydrolase n=1 Tax=Candidatus Bealeia paramacronuclearis TaxID=1921001 RepID=A0ABZ2C831_9PROT|nr:Aminoacyl-tRNA hydrolase [Candidatus Bealeia paramacronuclearis]
MSTPLFVGLGNPGSQYAKTRHNVGFLCVDEMMSSYGFSAPKSKEGGLLSEGFIDGQKVLIFKPLSYMNLSGSPVGRISQFYKIPTEKIFVFHDDLDLAPGKIKMKQGGGHGGHNGLKSLDSHIGKNYWRIRLGIGHPGHKDMVSDYVLHPFSKKEMMDLGPLLSTIADEAHLLYTHPEQFISRVYHTLGQGE